MSWNPQFDQSKTLFLFGGAVLVFLLITRFVFHRESENSEHSLPQVQTNNFESEVLIAETPVLVDFYADWCGPCRQMEPILADFARENPHLKVVQVNVDENRELADRYHIDAIPTFLVFKKGEMTTQRSGRIDKDELKAMIDR